MPKTRILIVDDSVVARRLLTDLLQSEPDCEVVGAAATGKIAIARIPQLNPDIVTLDVEMPDLDGLETLAAIRKIYPRLPVIMVSAVTERAADATLKALTLGATDYVTKPTAARGGDPIAQLREQLLPKIRGLSATRQDPTPRAGMSEVAMPPRRIGQPVNRQPVNQQVTLGARAAPVRQSAHMPAARQSGGATAMHPSGQHPVARPSVQLSAPRAGRGPRVDILAIGSSTGGPNALAALIPKLSADFPVPVVITQHMPPLFTRLLAERLDGTSPLRVHEANGGELLEPGHVYIAPGDYHMDVRREAGLMRLALHQAPPENSCRPAVDVMLRSVVNIYAGGTLAVILTGMGQDGLRGCERVREAGGQVVTQDEATSVVWGMPGAVSRAGLADAILPIEAIAVEVMRRVMAGARPSTPHVRASAPG